MNAAISLFKAVDVKLSKLEKKMGGRGGRGVPSASVDYFGLVRVGGL